MKIGGDVCFKVCISSFFFFLEVIFLFKMMLMMWLAIGDVGVENHFKIGAVVCTMEETFRM